MLTSLSEIQALTVSISAWIGLGVGVGYYFHRLPARRLRIDGPLTRLRAAEADGAFYRDRLRIARWKDLLPEAGALFSGGVSKKQLQNRRRDGLLTLLVETRRAERVHWTLLAASALFPLWNPPLLAVSMVAYGFVANVPFIAVQRYNRARLLRILSRADARKARTRATASSRAERLDPPELEVAAPPAATSSGRRPPKVNDDVRRRQPRPSSGAPFRPGVQLASRSNTA